MTKKIMKIVLRIEILLDEWFSLVDQESYLVWSSIIGLRRGQPK